MIKFSECTISKAIKNGINLSCLKGRTIVCKVKKGFFAVDHDNNIVKFEKGDIIVCSPNMDTDSGKCIGLCLSEEIYVKRLSPDSFIKYDEDEDEGDFWQYTAECSLEQFKETFEVLAEETAALESCIEKSKSCYKFLIGKKENVYQARDKYLSKANFRQGALGVILITIGVVSYVALITKICISVAFANNTPLWVFALIMIALAIFMSVGAALILFVNKRDAFECFESKKTPLLDKAEEEYKEHYKNTIYNLAVFRRKADWICP